VKIINHPTGAGQTPGSPDGSPERSKNDIYRPESKKMLLANRDPEKEYKGEIKERVVKTFIGHLQNLGYSHGTILVAQRSVTEYLEQNPEYKAATKTTITNHYQYLKQRPNKTRPGSLSDSVVSMHMYSIRLFYDFLEQTGIIENPTTLIRFPKAKYKERIILTREEIRQLYSTADTMKEKAFLALFYGCGLRRSEAERLNVHDIDMESGLLYVREGKGKKRRAVPMSEKVKADLGSYINLERKCEIKLHREASLMINGRGTRMTKSTYYKFFGRLLVKSGINKPVSIHNLRHTIATHLLESGLEIEQVRSFLGHAELETTQIYTRVQWKN
jgi:integrase/recombinase XerD